MHICKSCSKLHFNVKKSVQNKTRKKVNLNGVRTLEHSKCHILIKRNNLCYFLELVRHYFSSNWCCWLSWRSFFRNFIFLDSVCGFNFRVLVGEPVGQVEDDEDWRRDPHGPQVDVVTGLLNLEADALLEIHLGQGGLRGIGYRG